MSCNCTGTNNACIKAYVGPCDPGISTGITAPVTGNYLIILEFNGSARQMTLSAAANTQIVLPNVINNSAVFDMQIYKPDGSLLNDTCYTLKTIVTLGSENAQTPPNPPGAPKKFITVAQDGAAITDAFFATNTIAVIIAGTQSYIAGVDFTQSGATITGLNGLSFYIGQIILAET